MWQLFLQMLLIKAGDTPKEVEVESSQFFICSTQGPLPSALPKVKPKAEEPDLLMILSSDILNFEDARGRASSSAVISV